MTFKFTATGTTVDGVTFNPAQAKTDKGYEARAIANHIKLMLGLV